MLPSETHLSIQESLYPDLTCFGCGRANPDGFQLRGYRDGDETVATFAPRPEHDTGFGFLNGGIITTVLDCHTAAVARTRLISEDQNEVANVWKVATRHLQANRHRVGSKNSRSGKSTKQ